MQAGKTSWRRKASGDQGEQRTEREGEAAGGRGDWGALGALEQGLEWDVHLPEPFLLQEVSLACTALAQLPSVAEILEMLRQGGVGGGPGEGSGHFLEGPPHWCLVFLALLVGETPGDGGDGVWRGAQGHPSLAEA